MKKFFKVVTVSTVGLLFTMTNDVAAAGGAASSADPLPRAAAPIAPGSWSLFAPMLDRRIESDKSTALNQIASHLHGLIDSKTSRALSLVSRGTPKHLSVKMTGGNFMRAQEKPGYFDDTIGLEISRSEGNVEGIYPAIQAMGSRLKSLTIHATMYSTPLPDALLPALTNLKSIELEGLYLSGATVDHLIERIEQGLSHLKAMVVGGDRVRLWQHIISLGSACDLESKADAHQRLWNEPRIPYATNPHALAILCLGLPEDNQYVVWAHERLAGKHNKRTIPIRIESGFLLEIYPPTF